MPSSRSASGSSSSSSSSSSGTSSGSSASDSSDSDDRRRRCGGSSKRSRSRSRSPRGSGGGDVDDERQKKRKSNKDRHKDRHKKDKKKHKKKHHSKEKKKKKESREERKRRKRLVKEAKAFLKKQLREGGGTGAGKKKITFPRARTPLGSDPSASAAAAPTLTQDDYYLRSREFHHWLQEAKGQRFNDIPSSEEARKLFDEFARGWNGNSLPRRYYSGTFDAAGGGGGGGKGKEAAASSGVGVGGGGVRGARLTTHDWKLKGATATTTAGNAAATFDADDFADPEALRGARRRAEARAEARAAARSARERFDASADELLGERSAGGGRERTAEQRAAGTPQGRNDPGELPRIAAVLAGLRGMTEAELALATTHNACSALPRLTRLLGGPL